MLFVPFNYQLLHTVYCSASHWTNLQHDGLSYDEEGHNLPSFHLCTEVLRAFGYSSAGSTGLTALNTLMNLRITAFADFDHRPEFEILRNTTFRKRYRFPSLDEGRETPTLLGALERANINSYISTLYLAVFLLLGIEPISRVLLVIPTELSRLQ
jgi:hypothetical protein